MAEMYAVARASEDVAEGRWRRYRTLRDELFATHPCSPLTTDDRRRFAGVPYYPYDPSARVTASAEGVPGDPFEIVLKDDGALRLARVARLAFEVHGRTLRLALYRLLDYGSGLFLPFSDATAGQGTYGGGRYLIDTRKHAELGTEAGRIVLDFNFAYHPSCAYSPRWDCPLAPFENRLDVAIHAGERLPETGWSARSA